MTLDKYELCLLTKAVTHYEAYIKSKPVEMMNPLLKKHELSCIEEMLLKLERNRT